MEVVKLIEKMQSICNKLRRDGHRVKLVPTMGALHNGHASLIKAATKADNANANTSANDCDHTREDNDTSQVDRSQYVSSGRTIVIVSIFVNRLQFNDQTDYDSYPNTIDADLELCKSLDVQYVFLPNTDEMYPHLQKLRGCTIVPPDQISRVLEGEDRPGHFQGMLTCVCKLFNITRPHEAYFGEKDYQQLVLVSKMVQDFNMDIRIEPVETARESDLLPLSSRNVRLSQGLRDIAPVIYKILTEAELALATTAVKSNKIELTDLDIFLMASACTSMCIHLDKEHYRNFDIAYLALRCGRDFSRIIYDPKLDRFYCEDGCAKSKLVSDERVALECRLLIAAVVGGVRLLDNIKIKLNEPK